MDMERIEQYKARLRAIESEHGHDSEKAHALVDDVMIEIIRYGSRDLADTIEDLDIHWWCA